MNDSTLSLIYICMYLSIWVNDPTSSLIYKKYIYINMNDPIPAISMCEWPWSLFYRCEFPIPVVLCEWPRTSPKVRVGGLVVQAEWRYRRYRRCSPDISRRSIDSYGNHVVSSTCSVRVTATASATQCPSTAVTTYLPPSLSTRKMSNSEQELRCRKRARWTKSTLVWILI